VNKKLNPSNLAADNSLTEAAIDWRAFKPLLWKGLLLFILWGAFCWQGLATVVNIWWGNEIFNHGFFIVPGALYLIYLQRFRLLAAPIKPSLAALIIIIPAILLYATGVAGDIRLFMHIATFALLPSFMWLLLGNQAAGVILFPLCFMLFSVPVGEQLIPYLQEIAADGSVALLKLSGVPLYRSGLYIEIPQGRFLVAEACSGVSFFIASFVIGSLYAHLNLTSTKRRIVFVLISLIFPILANIVRVYGIILIAYWTDMEYAAGADHLIYGWFFFAFVIVCLLGLGELMREKQPSLYRKPTHTINILIGQGKVTGVALLMILATCWVVWINKNTSAVAQMDRLVFSHIPVEKQCFQQDDWEPVLSNPDKLASLGVNVEDSCVTVVHAWFGGVENELVSSLNRLFSPHDWSRVNGITLPVTGMELDSLSGVKIASPIGVNRYVTSWYFINGHVFKSDIEAKLYQVYLALLGEPISGSLIMVSSHDLDALSSAVELLLK